MNVEIGSLTNAQIEDGEHIKRALPDWLGMKNTENRRAAGSDPV